MTYHKRNDKVKYVYNGKHTVLLAYPYYVRLITMGLVESLISCLLITNMLFLTSSGVIVSHNAYYIGISCDYLFTYG